MALGTQSHPLFRYDLQTDPVTIGADRFVDVQSAEGKRFRLFEVEYAIACGMDGTRSINEIVQWAASELELTTNAGEVEAVVRALADHGYLDATQGAPQAEASQPLAAHPAASSSASMAAAGGDEVELGASGRSPAGRPQQSAPIVTPTDFELGEAGPRDVPVAEKPEAAEIELGAAGYDDPTSIDAISPTSAPLSTDLSESFQIDSNKVQEAVRASKVMEAVAPPDDVELNAEDGLLEEEPIPLGPGPESVPTVSPKTPPPPTPMGAKATPPPPPTPAPLDPAPEAPVAPAMTPAQALADTVAETADDEDTETGAQAIVLPEEPAQPIAAPAAAKESKPIDFNSAPMVLWLLFLLAAIGGAAYYYWNYVRVTDDDQGVLNQDTAKIALQSQGQTIRDKGQDSAPVQAPIFATLKREEGSTAPVLAAKAGRMAWQAEEGSEVEEGAVIAKLSGFERFDRKIERDQASMADYQKRLDALKASGASASRIAALQANVTRKAGDVEASKTKQAEFFVVAPSAGTLTWSEAAQNRLREGAEIGTVARKEKNTASFAKSATPPAVGDELRGQLVGDDKAVISCVVTEVDDKDVHIDCSDNEWGEGWEDGSKFRVLPKAAEADKPASVDNAESADGEATDGEATDGEAAAEGATEEKAEPAKAVTP